MPGKVQTRGYPGNNEAYADLAAGRVAVVSNSLPNIAYVAQQRPDTFEVVHPAFGEKSYFGYISRKVADGAKLADAVDAFWLKLKRARRLASPPHPWFDAPIGTRGRHPATRVVIATRCDRAYSRSAPPRARRHRTSPAGAARRAHQSAPEWARGATPW